VRAYAPPRSAAKDPYFTIVCGDLTLCDLTLLEDDDGNGLFFKKKNVSKNNFIGKAVF